MGHQIVTNKEPARIIVDRISFTTSIPVAAYGIKDVISAEAIVVEGANREQAFRDLIEYVEQVRNEKYPHLYGIQNSEPQQVTCTRLENSAPPAYGPPPSLEDEIASCKDLENLKSCHFLIKATKDEVLKRKLLLLYDIKLEELKKQTALIKPGLPEELRIKQQP